MNARSHPHKQMLADLTTLAATVSTLMGMPTPNAKGKTLVDAIRANPRIEPYLRAAYCPGKRYGLRWDKTVIVAPAVYQRDPPTLIELLRSFYTGGMIGIQAKAAWAALLNQIKSREIVDTANNILNRDLLCGLTPALVSKVLVYAGYAPLDLQPPDKLVLEFYGDCRGGVMNGDLLCGGLRAGTVQLHLGGPAKQAAALLRAGTPVEIIVAKQTGVSL